MWRGINGWIVRLSFRPLVWFRRSLFCTLISIAAIYPSTIFSADVRITQRKIDPVAEATELEVKSVYSELASRMINKSDLSEIRNISEAIVDECHKTGVDQLFVLSIIEVESNFDVEAISSSGARGLMQLMPGTFREVSSAKRMFDPVENVRAGIRYLAKMHATGFTWPETILLAYNQGPGTASKVGRGVIGIPVEAKTYIPKVLNRYKELLTQNGKNPKDIRKLFVASK